MSEAWFSVFGMSRWDEVKGAFFAERQAVG
jgi:hypothetical protein